jgi:hypothetical protein
MRRANDGTKYPDNTGYTPPDPKLNHPTVMRECFLAWCGQDQVIQSYFEIVDGPSKGWMMLTTQKVRKS